MMHGLNIREPFATLIALGIKTIETRRYKIPTHLIGRRIAIIATGAGTAKIIAYATLQQCSEFNDVSEFNDQRDQHLIQRGTEYDWDGQAARYKWHVSDVVMTERAIEVKQKKGIVWTKLEPQYCEPCTKI